MTQVSGEQRNQGLIVFWSGLMALLLKLISGAGYAVAGRCLGIIQKTLFHAFALILLVIFSQNALALTKPTLLSPANDAEITTASVTFSWSHPYNDQYELKIKDSVGTLKYASGKISSKSITVNLSNIPLTYGSTYKWYVVVYALGDEDASEDRWFTYKFGRVDVNSGVGISPATVTVGQNFTVSFSLKEFQGGPRTFEYVKLVIQDGSGNDLYPAWHQDNVSFSANQERWFSPTTFLDPAQGRGAGTYRALVKGKVAGMNEFPFDVISGSGAVNPRTFTAVAPPDTTKPVVSSFNVTPSSVSLGGSFSISYTVSDAGGSGLKQVELWRANDSGGIPGEWAQITTRALSGNGPSTGSFSNAPSVAGTYWYGVHVVDNAGHWNPEPEPLKVTVVTASVSNSFTWPVDPTNPTMGHYGPCNDSSPCFWISNSIENSSNVWRDAQAFSDPQGLQRASGHLGADYNKWSSDDDENQPVYPTAVGTVSQVLDNQCGWGNIVFIRHDVSFGAGVYTSMYAHVNWQYGRPSIGDPVTPNNPIAGIGKGNWTKNTNCTTSGSYPAHLHFEIRRGDRIDIGIRKDGVWVSAYEACDGLDDDANNCWARQVDPNAFIAAHHGVAAYSTCNTVTTSNFYNSAYNSYGAPFDPFQTGTMLVNASCSSSYTDTIQATVGILGDTTRIVYTRGYYYVNNAWSPYTGTCNGKLNGDWCQGSISSTITDANLSTASAAKPTYFVGMICRIVSGQWRCGCRDTVCNRFYWQIQGAGQ